MKKVLFLFIIMLSFIIPTKVSADYVYISKYYIDATILSNGDVDVKELFVLKGKYNGALKELNYLSNNYYQSNPFEGSSMYNGNDIVLKSIKEIEFDDNFNFSYINNKGIPFKKTSSAENGDALLYTVSEITGGYNYKLYNRSLGEEKAFYIEYTIKNLAVKHNDVGELWMSILRNNPDYVDEFEMYIHVPGNKDDLRVWAHGPLIGNIEKVDINTAKVTLDYLYSGHSIDVRLAFDRDVIKDSVKTTTYYDALDQIIAAETKWADIANKEREEAAEYLKRLERASIITSIIQSILISGLIGYVIYIILKHDKEHKAKFNQKYYRDFPSEITPPTVGYLIRGKINNDDLSASILYLIYKKVISFEELPKKDYQLKLLNKDNLSNEDNLLIDFLFDNEDTITFKELKKSAEKKYQTFLKKYTLWIRTVRNEAKNKNFYEDKSIVRIIGIIYAIILIVISFLMTERNLPFVFVGITMVVSVVSIIYLSTFSKRTIDGVEQYNMWKALKNFMIDFGRMDEKELPHVTLWEKYLIYALTLGCAKQLSQVMKIKAEELSQASVNNNILFDYYRFTALTNFTSQINSTVSSIVSNAYSAQAVANSSHSSGSGLGGGFSSGGGFSGGGGGSTGHF